MNSYPIYAVLILYTTFLPVEDAGQQRTQIDGNENIGGSMINFVSRIVARKKAKPTKDMDSVNKDTLTYVKKRLLLFFEKLDEGIFPNEHFRLTQPLEKVRSTHIGIIFQRQELKSNWGLPLVKNYISTSERENNALDKIKAAFFQVFENYRKKLKSLKNKRENYIKNNEGIKKKLEDCKEKFIIEKYTVNDQIYKLLTDLGEDKMDWVTDDLAHFEDMINIFGKEDRRMIEGRANWNQGMKPKGTIVYFNESTSGTDWTTDEILSDEFEPNDECLDSNDEIKQLKQNHDEEEVKLDVKKEGKITPNLRTKFQDLLLNTQNTKLNIEQDPDKFACLEILYFKQKPVTLSQQNDDYKLDSSTTDTLETQQNKVDASKGLADLHCIPRSDLPNETPKPLEYSFKTHRTQGLNAIASAQPIASLYVPMGSSSAAESIKSSSPPIESEKSYSPPLQSKKDMVSSTPIENNPDSSTVSPSHNHLEDSSGESQTTVETRIQGTMKIEQDQQERT